MVGIVAGRFLAECEGWGEVFSGENEGLGKRDWELGTRNLEKGKFKHIYKPHIIKKINIISPNP